MKRSSGCLVVAVGVAAVWVVRLGCWPLVVWSPLNCSYEDVDLNSGRIRRQRYLLGLCVGESIEDSALSLAAGPPDRPAEWRRVNTFSPMVHHSPHYLYHGAISQISLLQMLRDCGSFTPAASQETARNVLTLWQRGEGVHPVGKYLNRLGDVALSRNEGGEPVDVKDLPSLESLEKPKPP